MIKYLVVIALCASTSAFLNGGKKSSKMCLTGRVTDVQNWVDEEGRLLYANIERHSTVDLSTQPNPGQELKLMSFRPTVKILSLARCQLTRVPSVFDIKDTSGQSLSATVEYMTLYGNKFLDISTPGVHYGMSMNATAARETDVEFVFRRPGVSAWTAGFQGVIFKSLKQLDLRRCSIQVITEKIFTGMPNLEALFLGENCLTIITGNSFHGLKNLVHLDLSKNYPDPDSQNLMLEKNVFKPLEKLRSLDLSFTNLRVPSLRAFYYLGPYLERLSLCYTGLPRLEPGSLSQTQLRYLDLSGNMNILPTDAPLKGLENLLEVLYADEIGLKCLTHFVNFDKLEILRLRGNEINEVSYNVTSTLRNLQVLDLSMNRVQVWVTPIFREMPALKYLSLRANNLNMISNEMLIDFSNITYLGLAENSVVCNCQSRELFELAYKNENISTEVSIKSKSEHEDDEFTFHRGFEDFNDIIHRRNRVTKNCRKYGSYCGKSIDFKYDGKILLVDFDPNAFMCLLWSKGSSVPYSEYDNCSFSEKKVMDEMIVTGWSYFLAIVIIPTILIPLLVFLYTFRRNLKYFFITIRNSATLSLINNNKTARMDDGTIYNYDVFVSYCNDDRDWVLDYLLPHVEKNCNVCVCLHERDFQVGLSILENIVSCMDRSRSIMLILSKQFLASQWCQFEMHLAQHRLLETRREDLILILLEEIPRRLRPTTLHYLMLTKTYIVWPKNESERPVFWRRLKRSLVMHRIITSENISLA